MIGKKRDNRMHLYNVKEEEKWKKNPYIIKKSVI